MPEKQLVYSDFFLTEPVNQPYGLSWAAQIALVMKWAPAIALLTAITGSKPGRDRVTAVMALLQYAAAQTPIPADDKVAALTAKMLLTAEGGELVDYLHSMFTGLAEPSNHADPDRPAGT